MSSSREAMDRESANMPYIAFEGLLRRLRDERFRVGVGEVLAVQKILEQFYGHEAVDRDGLDQLAYRLAPILCRNEREQERFHRIFAEYVEDLSVAMEPVEEDTEERPDWWRRNGLSLLWAFVGTLVLLVVALFIWKPWAGGETPQCPAELRVQLKGDYGDGWIKFEMSLRDTFVKQNTVTNPVSLHENIANIRPDSAFLELQKGDSSWEQNRRKLSLIPSYNDYGPISYSHFQRFYPDPPPAKGKISVYYNGGCKSVQIFEFPPLETAPLKAAFTIAEEGYIYDEQGELTNPGAEMRKTFQNNSLLSSSVLPYEFTSRYSLGKPLLISELDSAGKEDLKKYLVCEWDVGDGNRYQMLEFQHTYAKPGKYPISLRVSTLDGKHEDIHTDTLLISSSKPPSTLSEPSAARIQFQPRPYLQPNAYFNVASWQGRRYLPYAALALILFWLIYEFLFLRKKRPYEAKKLPIWQPLKFPKIPRQLFQSLDFERSVMALRRRKRGARQEVDVDASIHQTIQSGGLPQMVFASGTRSPQYLVFVEQKSEQDHLAAFYTRMFAEIGERDVEVHLFYWAGDPQYCWSDFRKPESKRPLWQVVNEFPGARLLVAGQLPRLDYGQHFAPEHWYEILRQHNWRAWLHSAPQQAWGYPEQSFSEQNFLLPDSIQSLELLTQVWTGELEWEQVLTDDPEPITPEVEGEYVLESLQSYLGARGYRWLCACALHPDLYWQLTLGIGGVLNPSLKIQVRDLQVFKRLARIEWFRRGEIPEEFRLQLAAALDPQSRKAVEDYILQVRLRPENRPLDGSYAAVDLQAKTAIQKWKAEGGSRQASQRLQARLRELDPGDIEDPLDRRALAGAQPSFWMKWLPEHFFRGKMPLFGLKPQTRLWVVGLPVVLAALVLLLLGWQPDVKMAEKVRLAELGSAQDSSRWMTWHAVQDLKEGKGSLGRLENISFVDETDFSPDKLEWSADGEWLASADQGGLSLLHFENGKYFVASRRINLDRHFDFAWHPEENLLLLVYGGGLSDKGEYFGSIDVARVRLDSLDDTVDYNVRYRYDSISSGLTDFFSPAWSPRGSHFSVIKETGLSSRLLAFEYLEGKGRLLFQSSDQSVTADSWNPEDRQLYYLSSKSGLKYWDPNSNEDKVFYGPVQGNSLDISYQGNYGYVADGNQHKLLSFASIITALGPPLWEISSFPEPEEDFQAFAWAPKDSRFAVYTGKALQIRRTGEQSVLTLDSLNPPKHIEWSPEGYYLAVSHSDRIDFYDSFSGKKVESYRFETRRDTSFIPTIAWNPSRHCVAVPHPQRGIEILEFSDPITTLDEAWALDSTNVFADVNQSQLAFNRFSKKYHSGLLSQSNIVDLLIEEIFAFTIIRDTQLFNQYPQTVKDYYQQAGYFTSEAAKRQKLLEEKEPDSLKKFLSQNGGDLSGLEAMMLGGIAQIYTLPPGASESDYYEGIIGMLFSSLHAPDPQPFIGAKGILPDSIRTQYLEFLTKKSKAVTDDIAPQLRFIRDWLSGSFTSDSTALQKRLFCLIHGDPQKEYRLTEKKILVMPTPKVMAPTSLFISYEDIIVESKEPGPIRVKRDSLIFPTANGEYRISFSDTAPPTGLLILENGRFDSLEIQTSVSNRLEQGQQIGQEQLVEPDEDGQLGQTLLNPPLEIDVVKLPLICRNCGDKVQISFLDPEPQNVQILGTETLPVLSVNFTDGGSLPTTLIDASPPLQTFVLNLSKADVERYAQQGGLKFTLSTRPEMEISQDSIVYFYKINPAVLDRQFLEAVHQYYHRQKIEGMLAIDVYSAPGVFGDAVASGLTEIVTKKIEKTLSQPEISGLSPIPRNNMVVSSLGNSSPRAPGSTPEAQVLNRRIVVRFIPAGQEESDGR